MAIHAHSTAAPALQRGLSPSTLATIEAEFAGLIAQPWPTGISVQSDPKLDVPNQPENFELDADCPGATGVVLPSIPTTFALPETGDLKSAWTLHARRELHQALEHGFALLDALGLGPAALDLIDDVIRDMDEIDGDADFEPWLGDAHFAEGISAFALDAEDDSEKYEGTALESYGCGFARAGVDDAEDDDPAEDETHPWRLHPASVAFAAQVANV